MDATRTTMSEGHAAGTAGRRMTALYCLVLGLAPFGVVAAGFATAQTPWFVAHAGSVFLANLGYGASLRGANCQILVYGDSSALAGIDPAILRARTGLSACNIAEPAGVTAVNGLGPVDSYLERNPRPRVFLFAFASENMPPNWKSALTEGILLRVREHRDLSTLALLARHPEDTLRFATGAIRIAAQGLKKKPLPRDAYTLRRSHAGYLPVPARPLTDCGTYSREREGKLHPADNRWIADIRARYGTGGSLVLVDAMPRPACDRNYAYFARQHVAPTDNRLEPYPLSLFNTSGQLHMTRAGAVRFSTTAGDQIAARLRERGAPAIADERR